MKRQLSKKLGPVLFGLVFLLVGPFGCKTIPPTPSSPVFENHVVLIDNSQRLHNAVFRNEDSLRIRELVSYFRNQCVMPGKKIGDRSRLCLLGADKKLLVDIDLDSFSNLMEKQKYVNDNMGESDLGLSADLSRFIDEAKGLSRSANARPLEITESIWAAVKNYFKRNQIVIVNGDSVEFRFINHLHVFTDGYLEVPRRVSNEFSFDTLRVLEVRRFCQENNVSLSEAIASNPKLRLATRDLKGSQDWVLHIHETIDRDLNPDGTLKRGIPDSLRQNKILEEVWRNWAAECGFIDFYWYTHSKVAPSFFPPLE